MSIMPIHAEMLFMNWSKVIRIIEHVYKIISAAERVTSTQVVLSHSFILPYKKISESDIAMQKSNENSCHWLSY